MCRSGMASAVCRSCVRGNLHQHCATCFSNSLPLSACVSTFSSHLGRFIRVPEATGVTAEPLGQTCCINRLELRSRRFWRSGLLTADGSVSHVPFAHKWQSRQRQPFEGLATDVDTVSGFQQPAHPLQSCSSSLPPSNTELATARNSDRLSQRHHAATAETSMLQAEVTTAEEAVVDDPAEADLPKLVSLLRMHQPGNPLGSEQKFWVLGTAHVSARSAQDVR